MTICSEWMPNSSGFVAARRGWASRTGGPPGGLTVSEFLCVLYLVGTLGTWLVVALLAGHFNDRGDNDGISVLSPATICFTIGAVIATVMVTKGKDLIETAPERR